MLLWIALLLWGDGEAGGAAVSTSPVTATPSVGPLIRATPHIGPSLSVSASVAPSLAPTVTLTPR